VTSRRLLHILAPVLLAGITIGVYSTTTGGQFTSWDDEFYVTGNLRVQHPSAENLLWFFTHPYFNSYTPVAFMSHAFDWWVWGADSRGHHWHSVLLHAANTLLVFWLALRVLAKRGSDPTTSVLAGSFAAALLFTVHPLRVESVAWISDRKDLLAALFALLASLAYLKGTASDQTRRIGLWLSFSSLLFTAALLSKFLTVFLPAAILVAELTSIPARAWKRELPRLLRLKLFFLPAAIVVGYMAVGAIGAEKPEFTVEGVTLAQRLSLLFASPWFYLTKLALPANLSPLYNFPLLPSTWLTAIPILGITAGAVWLARNGRQGVLGAWTAYLLLLSPTFLFLSPLIQHTADRHSYLATIPLFLLAGGGVAHLWESTLDVGSGRAVRATLALLLLLFASWHAAISIRQARVWESSLSLWSQVVTIAPELPMGYVHLGDAVARAGNLDDAVALYERATRIEKAYGHAWTRIGIIAELKGDREEAERAYRKSVAANPEYAEAYINLGDLLKANGDLEGARAIYRAGIAQNQGHPKLWGALGALQLRAGSPDSALACFERAVACSSVYAEGEWGMAQALERLGRDEEASGHLRKAAELGHLEARKKLSAYP
jgi:tetratricopeptide (TPR) repeat protein